MVRDARETVRVFVEGWLIEPLRGVIRTIRAGGKGEVLVHGEESGMNGSCTGAPLAAVYT
ncbi:hypothetical protein BJ912DRAFT_948776 [Pholiota molesta]|nr:hypothetical protein BJ912DRAFT_948776 [Pholiota molesta]